MTTACLVCANIQVYFKGDRCSYCSYLRYSSYYLEINYIKVIPLGETPRNILAVHVIIVCNAMPGEHIHRCRTKYEVGAVHEAGIREPRKHRRPYQKFSSGGGMGLAFHAILLVQNSLRELRNKWVRNCNEVTMDHHEKLGRGVWCQCVQCSWLCSSSTKSFHYHRPSSKLYNFVTEQVVNDVNFWKCSKAERSITSQDERGLC